MMLIIKYGGVSWKHINIEYLAKNSDSVFTVEDVQDIIEKQLIKYGCEDVARAYIVYRDERTRIRNRNTRLMRSIGEKLKASNVKNQNANVDEHSFGGRKGEVEIMQTCRRMPTPGGMQRSHWLCI